MRESRFLSGMLCGALLFAVGAIAVVTAHAALKSDYAKALDAVSAPNSELDKVREVGDYLGRVSQSARVALAARKTDRAIRLLSEARKVAKTADDVVAAAGVAIKRLDDGVPDDVAPEMFFVAEPPFTSASAPGR